MPDTRQGATAIDSANIFDVIVVGAGIAGLYMLHCLRRLGMSARVYEAGSAIGGTWFWNQYPGASCDIESLAYSYSFSRELEQEWSWLDRYARQPELLQYLNHVADRFDLRRNIQCGSRVVQMLFDASTDRWTVQTDLGEYASARFCVMATGCLSAPVLPSFTGLETFKGDWHQTACWPPDGVGLADSRVAVIGTGSSGIQAIPIIAREAEHVFAFQRTANFSVPAWNCQLDPEYQRGVKVSYPERREAARSSFNGFILDPSAQRALDMSSKQREREYEARWQEGGFYFANSFSDLLTSKRANDTIAAFVEKKIREIVNEPRVAELLIPSDHPFGSKRVCVDTDYYATFNQDNVTLVDVRSAPIREITPIGVRTTEGIHEVDVIIFATGFDAITGAVSRIDVRGTGGMTLAKKWSVDSRAYLGLMPAGFPNLFLITGPGSPSVLSNMVLSIEQHVDWITNCIDYMLTRGVARIEASEEAEESWRHHCDALMAGTLYPLANSWYLGANVPGKGRTFLPYVGGVGAYRQRCEDVVADGYAGCSFNGTQPTSPLNL